MDIAQYGVELAPPTGIEKSVAAFMQIVAASERATKTVQDGSRRQGQAMRNTGAAAEKSAGGMQRLTGALTGGANAMAMQLQRLGPLGTGLATLTQRMSQAAQSTRGGVASFVALSGAATALIGVLVGVVAVVRTVRLAFAAIREAAGFQAVSYGLTQIIGNAEVARKKILELEAISDLFDMRDVMTAAQQLLLMGTGLDNLVTRVEAFQKIAARTNGATVSGIVSTYNRMVIAIGEGADISRRELNSFAQEGLNLEQILREGVGKSIEDINKMSGGPAAKMALINKALEIQAAKMDTIAGRGKTWEGALRNIQEKWLDLLRIFGTPIIEAATPMLERLVAVLSDGESAAQKWGETVATALNQIFTAFESGRGWEEIGAQLSAGIEAAQPAIDRVGVAVGEAVRKGLAEAFNPARIVRLQAAWVSEQASTIYDRAHAIMQEFVQNGVRNMGLAVMGWLGEMTTRFNDWVSEIFARIGDINWWNEIGQQAGTGLTQAIDGSMMNMVTGWLSEIPRRLAQMPVIVIRAALAFGKGAKDALDQLNEAVGGALNNDPDYLRRAAGNGLSAGAAQGDLGSFSVSASAGVTGPLGVSLSDRFGGSGDAKDASQKLETDRRIIEQYFEIKNRLKAELGETSREYALRLGELERQTAQQLADPAAYAGIINQWEAMQAAREKSALETQARIRSGEASMTEAMLDGIRRLTEAWGTFQQKVSDLVVGIGERIAGGIGDALGDIVTGSKSAGEAFRDMAVSMLKDISRMIIQMLVMQAIQTALGWIGGGVGFSSVSGLYKIQPAIPVRALGGPIHGPSHAQGGQLIEAEGGEYIIRKSMTRQHGIEALDALNRGKATIVRKFAEGGYNFSEEGAGLPPIGGGYPSTGGSYSGQMMGGVPLLPPWTMMPGTSIPVPYTGGWPIGASLTHSGLYTGIGGSTGPVGNISPSITIVPGVSGAIGGGSGNAYPATGFTTGMGIFNAGANGYLAPGVPSQYATVEPTTFTHMGGGVYAARALPNTPTAPTSTWGSFGGGTIGGTFWGLGSGWGSGGSSFGGRGYWDGLRRSKEAEMPKREFAEGGFVAPYFHSGGIIGLEGQTIPRYAGGGDVPFIGKRGEGVFTPGQMARMAPATGSSTVVSINVKVDNHNGQIGADAKADRSDVMSVEMAKRMQAVAEQVVRDNYRFRGASYQR